MTTVWGLSLRRCGALLRMNRSIQAEGVFGIIKWDRSYWINKRGTLLTITLYE